MRRTESNTSRRLTGTLIMGVIAVALVAGALILAPKLAEKADNENDNAEPTEDFAVEEPLFPDEQDATVTTFTLTNVETGDTFKASLDTDTLAWSIDEAVVEAPEGQVVDSTSLQSAVFSLPTLTPNRTLDQIEALGNYGLDAPAFTLEFTTSAGKTHTLEIGGQNPGGAAYYARVDGSDNVYLIPTYVLDPLFAFLTTPPYAEPTATPEPTAEATEPSS